MKLYHIPIEPYETRYTADWIKQFEDEFEKNNIDYETIYSTPVTQKILNGSVLDACGTHLYKFSQLNTIINKINLGEVKDGDVLFFSDLWFPGIESLFYIRNITNIKYKICGIFHAGTYDKFDFTYRTGMRDWGKYLEQCWFKDVDAIFVATDFHKRLIIDNSIDVDPMKIKVTGIPFYAEKLREKYKPKAKKENILVFPHRVEPEKHPELFDELVKFLENKGLNFKAYKTMECTKNRDEYFNLLARSKVMVSFADQETFGYATVECMALDNAVVVPNRLSYQETVPEEDRYNTIEEAFEMVYNKMKTDDLVVNYDLKKWADSVKNMLKEIERLN